MTQWSKEDLEEMCGDDVIDQLAFIAGCNKHRYSNDKVVPDGWIIPDESLRKFAGLIVRECAEVCKKQSFHYAEHNNKGSAASAANACRILINLHFGVEE